MRCVVVEISAVNFTLSSAEVGRGDYLLDQRLEVNDRPREHGFSLSSYCLMSTLGLLGVLAF